MAYIQGNKKVTSCFLCDALEPGDSDGGLIVFRGERVFVIMNRYPYTSGHLMVVPYDHRSSLELLDPETRAEMMEMASKCISVLGKVYHPQGYNLGINLGEAAGAGVPGHVHMHVLPRWAGDTSFISTVGETRVLPEALEDTRRRLVESWDGDEQK